MRAHGEASFRSNGHAFDRKVKTGFRSSNTTRSAWSRESVIDLPKAKDNRGPIQEYMSRSSPSTVFDFRHGSMSLSLQNVLSLIDAQAPISVATHAVAQLRSSGSTKATTLLRETPNNHPIQSSAFSPAFPPKYSCTSYVDGHRNLRQAPNARASLALSCPSSGPLLFEHT